MKEKQTERTQGEIEGDGLGADAERTLREDPLLRFLGNRRNSQIIALVLLALFCGWYVNNALKEQALVSRRLAADTYRNVREEFERFSDLKQRLAGSAADIEDPPSEKGQLRVDLEESEARLREILKSMADSRFEYRYIAAIYQALVEQGSQAALAMSESLGQFNKEQLGKGQAAPVFYTEAALLLLARAFLESEESLTQGRELLSTLISQGSFLNTAAAYSLALISDSPEEKEQAYTVITQFLSKHPEQAELLEIQLKGLAQG